MDTLQNTIFTDQYAEWTDIQSASPSVDLTDLPLTPDLISPFTTSPSFYITQPVSKHAYYDIEFMLTNNYWGCDFNYGNSLCGIHIRQGIAHLVDKAKFVADEPSIAGQAVPIDNPVPPDNGGLPSANPCAWDSSFSQSGSQCVVGSRGGTAYHLANATGANGSSWLPARGSPDFCAAADHFIAAGIASGKDATTCVLTGISAAALAHVPSMVIWSSDPPRLHFGDSFAEQICALFTGTYTIPCTYFNPRGGCEVYLCFPGAYTSDKVVNQSWWIYTGFTDGIYPFDRTLYHSSNSQFVSGIPSIKPPNGPCSINSVPSLSAPNYMYLCNSAYDSISSQMENAPCLGLGPALGQPSNNAGDTCPSDPTKLSSISAGVLTEDAYGKGAYSIPIFSTSRAQFGYLSNWNRVINNQGAGIPAFFTWLNAHNSNPAVAGTIRQAFSEPAISVSPYAVRTPKDFYVLGNIYDSLAVRNPLDNTQILNWMTINEQQLPLSEITYSPPSGTSVSFRFTLRPDIFFQDGTKLTAFDVVFTYLSMLATGSSQSSALSSISGITVLSPVQFDINVKAVGPSTLADLTSIGILPGRYWTSAGAAAWDSSITSCARNDSACYPAQYTLTGGTAPNCSLVCVFRPGNMNVDVTKITANYDPLAAGILIGSGPWECSGSSIVGTGCSSSGKQNPPPGGSYTLQRFGKGLAPASSISGIYFRSPGNLALYAWSQDNGDITHDFLNFSVVAACFGKPAEALGSTSACGHFQQGIGANGGPVSVGLNQVAIVNRFVGLNWVSPFNWVSSPPTGIAALPLVLYEGSYTMNPSSIVGCFQAYPAGGYDC